MAQGDFVPFLVADNATVLVIYFTNRFCVLCGKREAHINWSMVTRRGSTRYWNYLEDFWPCAGGLSAINAIATQMHDPINSGLNPMAYGGTNKWAPPRKSGVIAVRTRFSLSVEN